MVANPVAIRFVLAEHIHQTLNFSMPVSKPKI